MDRNKRLMLAGGLAIGLAVIFFVVMLGMAPKSNDPASMMQTVGQVSGVVGGIGLVMLIFGFAGKKKH
jgi:hypothetical protein